MRLILIALAASAAPMALLAQETPDAARCEGLRGLAIAPEKIGLPSGGADVATAVMRSEPVTYCEVKGAIDPVDPEAPDINFQVNLPYDWNRKGLHYGGGGYNGALVTGLDPVKFNPEDAATPVERGYATWGSDSGHQSSGLDGRFLLNDEALRNYGGEQLKKTYDVAMTVIAAFYEGAAPEQVYFQGSSQGGHEAMIAVERWPNDYDGAIVIHPANPFVGLQLSGIRAAQAFYQPGAYLSPADVERLNAAVMERCDALDGAEDGLVSNIAGCQSVFDIETLRCENGAPVEGQCFGDAQIAALEVLASRTETPPLQGGAEGFSEWPIYLGADLYGLWGMGSSPEPSNPPTPVENFGLAVLADPLIRYAILQDEEAETLSFDPTQHAARITEVSEKLDAVSADLSPFVEQGGKILLMHGITDFAIPYGNTVDWYERVVAEHGEEEVRDLMRFWLVPGFGHGSGAFQMRWNSLEALEAWVEEGTPPEGLISTDAATETAGRSRPMCEYPAFARMRDGADDPDSADSFDCVVE
ncbi:feruloyl esterase [Limimaricola variabilis]|uniref:Feruloyl esterase n=1 Tax=Limimaricola variabilis TaxID=1492771 RepID=A0ABR6HRD5_9RHOB|nr:tannase/feruloyl esterase family alpha/beta hydrolase [Limimaricola variabilis]MBB3713087.1 feruloyl esterase [Limimaricola variabilis]